MPAPRRLLVTGAGGLLAPYVIEAAQTFQVFATRKAVGGHAADLSRPGEVKRLLADVRPDAVIHAAGYTDVDGCEKNPARAFRDNALAAQVIAETMPADRPLIVVSTDQVYPDSEGPHREMEVGPVNEYGRSKLAGEWGARSAHTKTCVVRTNFFGASRTPVRTSLSDFMIEQFTHKRACTLFDDVKFSPLHMTTLASLLIELVRKEVTGTFNAGSRSGMSKAAFGLKIAELKKFNTSVATIGASSELPSRAARPRDLRLDVTNLEETIGRAMPTLEQELRLV